MKLNKDTYDPKLHKVTLKGEPVKIAGFGAGEYGNKAFYFDKVGVFGSLTLDSFEVSEIKRFRVGLFTSGVFVITNITYDSSKDIYFVKWLTDWTEYV